MLEITKTSIPYLDAVIEECLRMGNPVRILHREATVDTTILGNRIPKGTTIFLCNEGPGFKKPAIPVDDSSRSESSRVKYQGGAWDPYDLHLFNPERWLTEDKYHNVVFNPQAGPALSFSLGPRGCFGKKLAYLEIRMVMVLLIWNFKLRKLDDEMSGYDVIEGITTTPKHCYVSLEAF
jgi:cytochrome P450